MEAATEARSPAVGIPPHDPTVIEATERAGMGGRVEVRVCLRMESRHPLAPFIVKCGDVIGMRAASIETVAMVEGVTVGDVGLVVVDHPSVVPVEPPVVHPPSDAGEEADADACSEVEVRPFIEDSRNSDPAWIGRQRRAVHEPRVVSRHVNELWVYRLDHDRLALRRHGLLGCAHQASRCLRLLAQHLNRNEHVLRPVHIGVAERRGPAQVRVHVLENRGKLRERLDAWVPWLLIHGVGELLSLQTGMLLHPAPRLHDLGRIRRGGEDLRDQRVRVQGDRCHQLLVLFGRQRRGLSECAGGERQRAAKNNERQTVFQQISSCIGNCRFLKLLWLGCLSDWRLPLTRRCRPVRRELRLKPVA